MQLARRGNYVQFMVNMKGMLGRSQCMSREITDCMYAAVIGLSLCRHLRTLLGQISSDSAAPLPLVKIEDVAEYKTHHLHISKLQVIIT